MYLWKKITLKDAHKRANAVCQATLCRKYFRLVLLRFKYRSSYKILANILATIYGMPKYLLIIWNLPWQNYSPLIK
jgi:hypothetical protein